MSRTITTTQSDAEKSLLDISNSQDALYQSLFVPLTDTWLSSINKDNAKSQENADIMGAEAAGQYGAAEQNQIQNEFASGIDPSSGKFLGLASDLANEKANAASGGITTGRNAAVMDYYKNGIAASNKGLGIASDATSGTYSAGALKAEQDRMAQNLVLSNKEAEDSFTNAKYNAIGGVVGVGAGYALGSATKKSTPIAVQGPSGPTVKSDSSSYMG